MGLSGMTMAGGEGGPMVWKPSAALEGSGFWGTGRVGRFFELEHILRKDNSIQLYIFIS